MDSLRVPGFAEPNGEFGLETQRDALAVAVDGAFHLAGLTGVDECASGVHSVQNQARARVLQGAIHPVGHLLGTPQPPGPRQHDRRRTVGGCVVEVGLLAPRNAAALGRSPGVEQFHLDLLNATAIADEVLPLSAFERQPEPRHVVVVVVGPPADVAGAVCSGDLVQSPTALGGEIAICGVDRAVEQMSLPPVVPAQEHPFRAYRWPGHNSQRRARQPPQPTHVPRDDGPLRSVRTLRPQLLHTRNPATTVADSLHPAPENRGGFTTQRRGLHAAESTSAWRFRRQHRH